MIRKIISAALLLAVAQPALADGPIQVREGRTFKHDRTGTKFPGKIAGFKLVAMHDFSDAQFDVVGIYGGIDDGDEISVYLYRAAIPDVSLWTGMVVRAIPLRAQFRPKNPADATPHFFAPPGANAATGMRMTYDTVAGQYAATGVALVPYGEWLLKVRVTSTNRKAQEIDALIDATLAAFKAPKNAAEAPAAYAVQPCADQLAVPPAVASTPGDDSLGATLLAVVLSSIVIPEEELKKRDDYVPPEPVVWCEDASLASGATIYRPNGRSDAYIVAFSDAGTHLSVGHVGGHMAQIAREMGTMKFPVVERTSGADTVRGLFDTLPDFDQSWQAMDAGISIASTDRESDIQINSDYLSKGD